MIKLSALLNDIVLHPHQQEAVDRFVKSDGQLLLNHRVGSGKTPTSIAMFEKLRELNKADKALVVVPSSLKNNYLHNGIRKFTDSSGVILGAKAEVDGKDVHHLDNFPASTYYVVSNEMFRKNPRQYIKNTGADTVIIDEIHKYKDLGSANYKGMMAVRPLIKNFIGMTGTPMTNHPRDLIPQLNIITNRKHQLGDYSKFNSNYIEIKSEKPGLLGMLGLGTPKQVTYLKNIPLLKQELNKYIHSYSKVEDNIPKKIVHEVKVPMSAEQNTLYDYYLDALPKNMVKKIRENMPVSQQEAHDTFTKIIKLRQLSNSLQPFDNRQTKLDSAFSTPKSNKLLDNLQDHLKSPNHKAIIYSNFYNAGVDVIDKALSDMNVPHGIYVGSKYQKREDRESAIKQYLDGKHRAIVIDSAGTEGLNLPGTTAHFTLDQHFNPAINEQAEARGIRAGSPVKQVDVNRYFTVRPKTLSEKLIGYPLFGKETSVDEWIDSVSKNKDELNKKFQALMT